MRKTFSRNHFFIKPYSSAVYYISPQSFILTFSYSDFDWLIHQVECLNDSTTKNGIYRGVILCIIIGDVYQFIGHCLFTLSRCIMSAATTFNKAI